MMTRKDFKRLAAACGRIYQSMNSNGEDATEAFNVAVWEIAEVCRQSNPRFDYDKFRQAAVRAAHALP